MAQNHLTVCYLTEKPNAIASIASHLKQAYPKLVASQTASVEEMLAIKGLDLIIADPSYRKIPSNTTILYVIEPSDIDLFIGDSYDFITNEELNTFSLSRAVKNMIERERLLNELKSEIGRAHV